MPEGSGLSTRSPHLKAHRDLMETSKRTFQGVNKPLSVSGLSHPRGPGRTARAGARVHRPTASSYRRAAACAERRTGKKIKSSASPPGMFVLSFDRTSTLEEIAEASGGAPYLGAVDWSECTAARPSRRAVAALPHGRTPGCP